MPLRILFIESGPGFGGSAVCLYSMLKHLNKAEFEPTLCYYHNGPNIRKINELGIKTFPLLNNTANPLGGYFNYLKRLATIDVPRTGAVLKIIKNENVSLVHVNNYIDEAAILAAKIARVPCVIHKRNTEGAPTKSVRTLRRLANAWITVSDAAGELELQNRSLAKKIVRIYDGIEVEQYKLTDNGAKIRNELGIPADKKVVGSISRIVAGKGHLNLIQAAATVIKEYPNVIFLVVGSAGNEADDFLVQCKQKAAGLGLEKQIIFTGWRMDIADILAAIDVLVHVPTAPEGLGTIPLEAMAMGKPTVVSSAGGLGETVADKVTGFVVPVGDVAAISQAILTLLRDEELANKMGKAGRKMVEAEFDAKKQIRKIENIYRDCCKNP